jgi:hypothetical protein
MDSLPGHALFDAMHFRYRSLEAYFSSKLRPSDWRTFVTLALEVEQDVHGGAAGAVDDAFYAPLFAYMKAVKAPAEAVAAISYSYALASWDWRRALAAGDTLMRAYEATSEWVPVDLLRDGMIVAQLRLGDPIGARRSATALAHRARDPESLRSMMLESYLVAAEREIATALLQRPAASLPRPGVVAPGAAAAVSGVPRRAPSPRTASGRTP